MSDSQRTGDPPGGNAWDWLQQLWTPLAAAAASMPGMSSIPTMFQPTLDAAEVDRRIHELKAVEQWLKMNVGFVQMSVQALEMQKAAIDSMRDGAQAMGDAAKRARGKE